LCLPFPFKDHPFAFGVNAEGPVADPPGDIERRLGYTVSGQFQGVSRHLLPQRLQHLGGCTAEPVGWYQAVDALVRTLEVVVVDEVPDTAAGVRSIHGASYTRLWNVDLLAMIREFATDFQPPQQAATDGTGLYAGEQDLFVFLIDPLGWTEIGGENYAPGFFVWNSEVGRRALGCQTFWFQAVCQNHIVWDATDVTEYTRKHTSRVHEGLGEIRAMIEAIVAKRDARKDGFVAIVRKAMETKLGDDAEEALKELTKNGITRSVATEAVTIAREKGRFTVWAVVDALTRLSQQSRYAGDRTEADQRATQLLTLVS
jgi:hypothetical protein